MDFLPPDAIQNVILGVIGNGFTSLIAHSGQKAKSFFLDEESLARMQERGHSLQGILENAADSVAEEIEWDGPASLEQVCLFLMSPEVEAIMRQIYSATLLESQSSFELIRQEFLTSFSLYTGIPKGKLAAAASRILDTLLAGCEYAITAAIDQGVLAAHEAQSSLRHRFLTDEIAAIRENLSFLTAWKNPNLDAILKFEEQYRLQVDARESYVRPPFIDTTRKIPIDEIYVASNFVRTSQKAEDERTTLDLTEFLSVAHRVVVLGNPGGGKSTFTQKVCHILCTQYADRLLAGRQVTPIRVVLREYGAEKKLRNCSILNFIEGRASSDYQIDPPSGAFEYMLLNGRAMVLFDGLDELIDTSTAWCK